MFSFYGSKGRLARYYPAPTHLLIIEPCAGSAKYALHHWERDVLLIDADPTIVGVWEFLIAASPRDVLSLPDIALGAEVPTSLSQAERALIGFCVSTGEAQPRRKAGRWNQWNVDRYVANYGACSRDAASSLKRRIAADLHKVKHWKVRLGDYSTAPDVEATWFVDPPYCIGGHRYRRQIADYTALALWCRNRRGQVIVCEADGADWLPFKPFRTQRVAARSRQCREVVWVQE